MEKVGFVLAFGALLFLGSPAQPLAPPPARIATTGVTVVASGDIASCASNGDEQTAALVSRIGPDAVLTLGDNAYPEGSAADFAQCFGPSWGAFKGITYPAPGNHEYATPGAAGYFDYFGSRARAPYYSFDLGAWHIVSLNSEVPHETGSAQERWLRKDLARNTKRCELLYWHRPRWSGGSHGSDPGMQPLWQAAYQGGVDLVLAGHDHNYQRFYRMDGKGRRDRRWGVREVVSGAGGASHYEVGPIDHLAAANGTTSGVVKLRLRARDYDLTFVPVSGGGFRDAIRGAPCHAAPGLAR
jgi:acid phosphatase type 7